MAELALIGGIGLIANIAIQSSATIITGGIIYKARYSIANFVNYYTQKRIAKKLIKTGIKNIDYEYFIQGFKKMKEIDRTNSTLLYIKYIKKYSLTTDIVNSKMYFKLKFDGEYLQSRIPDSMISNSLTEETVIIKKETEEKKQRAIDDINTLITEYKDNNNSSSNIIFPQDRNMINLSEIDFKEKYIEKELELEMRSKEIEEIKKKLFSFI